MIVIPGFEIQEQLNETEYTLVFRGIRLADNLPVIIKVLKNQYPSVEELAYYKGKYEMNLSLKIDGVTKVFGFESYLNTWMILEEDFGGDSLDKILSERKLDIPQILKLAISIITILGQLHRKRIIYKDLNPSKIIWNTETDQLKLINLGIFTSLSKEQTTFLSPNMLEEKLHYISPEQTGRINHSIDYRTDFYSFGATFYEILTGHTPFKGDDPKELINCHISIKPKPLESIDSEIPEILSKMVLKLMSKNPEDRYQGTFGLKEDLKICLNQWLRIRRLTNFELGRQDRVDKSATAHTTRHNNNRSKIAPTIWPGT